MEYLLHCVKRGTDLAYRLANLQSRMKNGIDPRYVLIEWKNAYQRFRAEGYQQ